MMSTRVMGMGPSLRQAAFSPARSHVARNVIRTTLGKRAVQTQSLKPEAATEILNKQRLNRPSSPHFTIYQPQLTWLGSIANRVTGGALSALLYGFSLAYLVAPDTFSSVNVVEFVGGLPEGVKYAGKAILAAPFSFHAFNGLRHLAWDSGKFLTVKGAYSTGYAVLGATAISTIYLTLQ
ncbi:succinate dehydrogenase cytochrome b560 subunit [Moniliophthora roreri MCA 2997]|uniref:Succinate dehydrogenase cytochrome b560 subunit n=2 Tax=Moniliophthora roreri TaxID=221103 RepID=V2Y2D1_MONRO|nr:succinate dehydrogenase cytochrome b560 subunit [Moniliophthora roreri MCA 2997]KAI3605714.1 succinate dehydrogenase cytochrome b560 subunit [Moniliophthora roreri]